MSSTQRFPFGRSIAVALFACVVLPLALGACGHGCHDPGSRHDEDVSSPKDHAGASSASHGELLKVYSGIKGPYTVVGRTHVFVHHDETRFCQFELSWRLPDESGRVFQMTVSPATGAVFPIHGELARFDDCYQADRSFADIEIHPSGTQEIAPEPESVFVPIEGGFATLDGVHYLSGLPRQRDAGEPQVAIQTWPVEKDKEPWALRVGDSFPWSGYTAKVLRIFEPEHGGTNEEWSSTILGWVEVALSARPRGEVTGPP
jgi:hypothetical protein